MAATAVRAGEIVLRLRLDGERVLAVALELRRPLEVVAVALDREPAAFLRMLPLLFPLCGMAHGLAGLRAVEAALGIAADASQQAARAVIARADAVAAHTWRWCFDWAALTGSAPDPAPVATARRLTEATVRALYPDGDWLSVGGGRIDARAVALDGLRADYAQLLDRSRMDQRLQELRAGMAVALSGAHADWLPRLDSWFRASAEQAHSDGEGLLHGLQRLAGTQAAAAAGLPDGASGSGSGSAATARGPLNYRVALRAGRVCECSVDAPIDRVFAADGEAAHWLAQLRHAAHPEQAARWIVSALDPCAAVRIETAEALHA